MDKTTLLMILILLFSMGILAGIVYIIKKLEEYSQTIEILKNDNQKLSKDINKLGNFTNELITQKTSETKQHTEETLLKITQIEELK